MTINIGVNRGLDTEARGFSLRERRREGILPALSSGDLVLNVDLVDFSFRCPIRGGICGHPVTVGWLSRLHYLQALLGLPTLATSNT